MVKQVTQKMVDEFQTFLKANQMTCDNLLKRRFVVAPGFEIHGGCAGLYDFGPTGSAIKTKLEQLWREHFVIYDDMLEIVTTCVTPHPVFKASGHVDKFCDLMVQDEKTGDNYRADKLLEAFIEDKKAFSKSAKAKPADKLTAEQEKELDIIYLQADSYTKAQMHAKLTELGVKSPNGNPISAPEDFNLMFKTNIGPRVSADNKSSAYLRPETAQGMFVNFKRLYEQNQKKLPMGTAQIGLGFRNEIAPRQGLIRVREFQMAEIEYFVDPTNKDHPNFSSVADLILPLFTKDIQAVAGEVRMDLTLADAVKQGVIANETLAYFMARTFLFFKKIGIQETGIRFRQHLDDEMAHYACDCWDGEILSGYGWIECCGHADRSAFDLDAHTKATGIKLEASRRVPEYIKKTVEVEINKKLMGPAFKKDAKKVTDLLEGSPEDMRMTMEAELEASGKITLEGFEITRPMVKFVAKDKKVTEEIFTPNVIEPSFGIGRIFNAVMEHSFRSRDMEGQEARNFLSLPPVLAPYNCCLLPLNNSSFTEDLQEIKNMLRENFISCVTDDSGASIGKRYARTDEIGIPFAITIDFQSKEDKTVTVRERDSMKQIRLPATDIPQLIQDLAKGRTTWEKAVAAHGITTTGAEAEN